MSDASRGSWLANKKHCTTFAGHQLRASRVALSVIFRDVYTFVRDTIRSISMRSVLPLKKSVQTIAGLIFSVSLRGNSD